MCIFNKTKSISFLLGAGFSVPKGYPICNQLNEKLLKCSEDNYAFSPDGHLVYREDGGKPDFGYKTHFDFYYDFCRDLIHYYNEKIKPFDYEEFYDYIITDAKTDSDLVDFFDSKRYEGGKADLNNYLFQIKNIFNQLVSSYLTDKDGKSWYDDEGMCLKPRFEGYTGFLDCLEKFLEIYIVNVHTLNHDLFFERLNRTEWINGILSDGFEELGSPYYGKLIHDNRSYRCRLEEYSGKYDTKLRLYKLHGSKDYYIYFREEGISRIPEKYIKGRWGIGSGDYLKEIEGENGDLEYENCWINYHPDFLTGTSSKIVRYNEPLLYKRLFSLFKHNLKEADKLIIIGYACKDSEINKMIIDNFGKNRPCYIINPYPGNTVLEFKERMGRNTKVITTPLDALKMTDFA